MDTEKLKQVVRIFESSSLTSMHLECEEMNIELQKKDGPAQPVSHKVESPVVESEGVTLNSPLVGTFYRSSAPDQPPYVEVGQSVKAGDVVCILEAMKAMNEIKASQDGIIEDILVNDGDMVQFDQPLMKLRTKDDSETVDR